MESMSERSTTKMPQIPVHPRGFYFVRFGEKWKANNGSLLCILSSLRFLRPAGILRDLYGENVLQVAQDRRVPTPYTHPPSSFREANVTP